MSAPVEVGEVVEDPRAMAKIEKSWIDEDLGRLCGGTRRHVKTLKRSCAHPQFCIILYFDLIKFMYGPGSGLVHVGGTPHAIVTHHAGEHPTYTSNNTDVSCMFLSSSGREAHLGAF